ncbi:MAG: 5'-nucleotidase C-terminal domain-containing protein [Bacteroidales bacterium]|nr:5'-nucleotidase C-terminal domain-containing protein [Bacteroidales bacterium]
MKKSVIILAAFAAISCAQTKQEGYSFVWTKHVMDGSLTGVTSPNAENVPEALGTIENGVYTAPNGKVFRGGSTPAVVADMLEVQPQMADLKQVIGYCEKEMSAYSPESELSNWTVDTVMEETARLTGKKVDVGFTNFGGIRTFFPEGPVLREDVEAMFPFKNYLCYVSLKGSDLRALFERFAKKRVEVVGGVEFVIKDRKIQKLLVGGKPVDDNKYYGVATIDFLLDGGDGVSIAKNAKELIITDVKVVDAMLPAARKFAEEGKPISYHTDGRVRIISSKEANNE